MRRVVWIAAAVLSVSSAVVAAQEKIYESTEKGGVPEFSDQPTPGATPITLRPPNVIDTTQPPARPQAPPQEVFTGYSQLAILFPAERGTMHTNTGAFDVRIAVEPALNAGDAFVITLDGTALAGRYTSGHIPLTEQDFQSAASADALHRLEVAVVDSGGNVLITSGPVNFYVHRATVHRRQVR